MKSLRLAIFLALVIGLLTATAVMADNGVKRFQPGEQSIAEIAVTNGSFNTLVTALSCTDLVGAVANPEVELTVFAPTDDAFASVGLNSGNVCGAFDTETLTTILLYHVVGERRPSPSVINGQNKSIEMLAGGSIYPEGKGSLELNDNLGRDVNIVMADILASNGLIHVIDSVLLPVAP